MANKEKVIKGLECCAAMSGDECRECPYGHECRDTDLPYGMPHLAADALALLKERESVEPLIYNHLFICPTCKNALFKGQKFCHECGQAVKWNE